MSNYTTIKRGTIQHAKSFWQLLNIVSNDSFAYNKQNEVHDTSDNNYYSRGFGVYYWPQNLQPGNKEWYWVGGNGIDGQYRHEDDTLKFIKPGFYKFVGSEGSFYNKLLGQPELCQRSHPFLVFEDDAGNRVRVRPGTIVLGEDFVRWWAKKEGFKLPFFAKSFWPNAAKECGVEDGCYKGERKSYSLKKELSDLVIITVIWLLLCFIGRWNLLFIIPFTALYIMIGYVFFVQIYYREVVLKKEEN